MKGFCAKVVIINDTHIPFEDKTACLAVIEFVAKRRNKIDTVIFNGDMCDFYQISRFNKDPERKCQLQYNLDETSVFLNKFRQLLPKAQLHYIEGNHEERLRKYLWSRAEELASLRSLKLTYLLNLDSLNIAYHKEGVQLGDLYIYHGSIIRKHAGYTARAEFEKSGCTGISGHSHRDGKYTIRTRAGQFAWWENYCLCDLQPEYIVGVANWSHGFSYITIINNRPYVEQIAIIDGKYIYNGKVIEVK